MGLFFFTSICKIGQRETTLPFLVSDIFRRPFDMPVLTRFHITFSQMPAILLSQLPISLWPSLLFILWGLSQYLTYLFSRCVFFSYSLWRTLDLTHLLKWKYLQVMRLSHRHPFLYCITQSFFRSSFSCCLDFKFPLADIFPMLLETLRIMSVLLSAFLILFLDLKWALAGKHAVDAPQPWQTWAFKHVKERKRNLALTLAMKNICLLPVWLYPEIYLVTSWCLVRHKNWQT